MEKLTERREGPLKWYSFSMVREPPDEATLRRALLFGRIPGITAAQVCARFQISMAALRRAKKTIGPSIRPSDGDLVCMALAASGALAAAQIIEYVDWLDHTRFSEGELAALLGQLEQAGLVRCADGRWGLTQPWP